MTTPLDVPVVAVVDDDPDVLDTLAQHLVRAGLKVEAFADPAVFVAFLRQRVPDLAVLDLMLPGIDGTELCTMMRRDDRLAHVPIVMLTARADVADRILGLELGADDYIVKPCMPREVVARVTAILRRTLAPPVSDQPLLIGDIIELHPGRMAATVSGEPVNLTHTEYRMLALFASRPGCVFPRAAILDHLWKHEKDVTNRTVDAHVKNLRRKLGPVGRMIQSVRSVGFKLHNSAAPCAADYGRRS